MSSIQWAWMEDTDQFPPSVGSRWGPLVSGPQWMEDTESEMGDTYQCPPVAGGHWQVASILDGRH